ncbi:MULTISPECIES: SpoVR family protein [Thermus]|uniref:Stage V sporulation protein R (SpoVR)-like protein n=1 Tax=Thermus brockianus TaxID=56956 RepID=A0A1J0LT33_THEBO|nr:SpoVR family protein [Thermus brockianus]APD08599.1 stage V sporulation protein R (SpoVR)-like protein [Thermus brockianus]
MEKELRHWAERLRERAEALGLSFPPVLFEEVTPEEMAMLAAYGGFPRRYPHWRWGSEYLRYRETYRYGLGRIYELVVNTHPVQAYLLKGNTLLAQKLVMAHVYAHADFFHHNLAFKPIPKDMLDEMAHHATYVEKAMERHGTRAVEEFLDLALSLENLIDPHAPYIQRPEGPEEEKPQARLRVRPYLDPFVNPPPGFPKEAEEGASPKPLPPRPTRDILGFLVQHAPLAPWQKGILEIIREESLYYAPQVATKILNEGWATYWHTQILLPLLTPEEALEFAELQAGLLAPHGLNPYRLGYHLLKEVEERWDKGRFGPGYEALPLGEKLRYERPTGEGRRKLFQVRTIYTDLPFLEEFLTPEFALRQGLLGPEDLEGFSQAKKALLFRLTNAGYPIVELWDANYQNRGELLLVHAYEGVELDLKKTQAVLENLHRLWGRPVHLKTVVGGKERLLSAGT